MEWRGHTYYEKAVDGTLNPYLIPYENGVTTVYPQLDDLLVFSGGVGGYGHVAIITEVGDNYVKVIEQNWARNDAIHQIPYDKAANRIGDANGNRGSYHIQGWLRKPDAHIFALSVFCKGDDCSKTALTPRDELTFVYNINNPNKETVTNIRLGAQIRTNDPQGVWLDDLDNDVVIDSIGPGETKDYSRKFIISPSATLGFYDIRGVILHQDTGDWIDSKEMDRIFLLQSPSLRARYYNEPIYRNDINAIAKPDVERIDPNVDFTWHTGESKLPPGILNDGWWSGDWAGYIYIDKDGIYNFNLNSDDGSWLFIDGEKVIDNGGDHAPQWVWGQKTLTKGYHSIWVKYFESLGGEANLNLYWLPPDIMVYAPIPQDKLYVTAPEEIPPKLQLSKKAPANMDPGNVVVYTLYYTNFGSKASNAEILDKLPPEKEVDFISASDNGVYDSAARTVKWTINSIDAFPNGVGSRTVTTRIKSDAPLNRLC